MKVLGVIPARYASTRFPGKPLADIHGKSMIERVYTQALAARRLDAVVVATDDPRIFAHVTAFGGAVQMTSPDHPTGTDRILEIAATEDTYAAYINIQGDEPYIAPEQIDQVAELLAEGPEAFVATLAKKLTDPSEIHDPNLIKVTFARDGRALYFSRSPIPYLRDAGQLEAFQQRHGYYKHIGIYGYTARALREIEQMPRGALEQAESLEQLRWLESGLPIYVGRTEYETQAVDTPEDLEKLRQWMSPER
ncbi:MAG: 3-deoxy-manno-octulosonate cytidylyltransferase [Bacteroidota bacterium]